MSDIYEILKKEFSISQDIICLAEKAEQRIYSQFNKIDQQKQYNQLKVIKAMQKYNLSETHFAGSTGYGYGDTGREVIDDIYKDVFKTEDAIVRHQIVSGTHSIALCMFAILRPQDELLSITGKPYDTLEEVIGIRGNNNGSLKSFGVSYKQLELTDEGKVDIENIERFINNKTKMVLVQRSKGYSLRPSIYVNEIKQICQIIKNIKDDVVILVDNCYGEFTEIGEPSEVGADLVAGSLIKNPGGGIALNGGYIAGKAKLIEDVSYRITAPGLGKKVGASLGNNRFIAQGLFFAPHVVAESLKGAIFCASIMENLNFEVYPKVNESRTDIIQAIKFNDKDTLIAFCQGIQKGCAVDAFVRPEPWDMPGYDYPVIMASGSFVQGSSIELSADAPIKPPFVGFLQGGLVYENVKLGVMMAIQTMVNKNLLKL